MIMTRTIRGMNYFGSGRGGWSTKINGFLTTLTSESQGRLSECNVSARARYFALRDRNPNRGVKQQQLLNKGRQRRSAQREHKQVHSPVSLSPVRELGPLLASIALDQLLQTRAVQERRSSKPCIPILTGCRLFGSTCSGVTIGCSRCRHAAVIRHS